MGQEFLGDDFRARAHDQLAETSGQGDFGKLLAIARALPPSCPAAQGRVIQVGEVDRTRFRAKKRYYLAKRQIQDFV